MAKFAVKKLFSVLCCQFLGRFSINFSQSKLQSIFNPKPFSDF